MKVSEAIQQVKMEKPNGYSDTHCTVFLNEIEAIIQEFLGVPRKDWVEYRWEDSQQQDLIVPEPYIYRTSKQRSIMHRKSTKATAIIRRFTKMI